MLRQVHVYVKGDVIGVGFRVWTKLKANSLNLKGWVRNVYDKPEIFGVYGGVEAVIQGKEEDIKKMLDLLKQGPETAYVKEVEFFWEEPKEVFEDFKIVK